LRQVSNTAVFKPQKTHNFSQIMRKSCA